MTREALSKRDLDRVRGTLAALCNAPQVREAVAAPRSSTAVRRRLIEGAGDEVFDAFGGELRRGAPAAAPFAAFQEVRMRLQLARAATTAELAAVVARSVERSADEEQPDRHGASFVTASGERITLRGLEPRTWKSLRPGCVGILWVLRVRPPAFVDFRELGDVS